MTVSSRIAPFALVVLAVIVCALPWSPTAEMRLVLPLLPYVVIHRCVERWGEATPDWLVFLAGFAADVAGQGPLGYWSLIYLCGYTMIRSATAERQHNAATRLLLFVVTIVSLAAMQWSVSSVYFLRSAEIKPLAVAAGVAFAAYVVVSIVIPAGSGIPARRNTRLQRGT